MHIYTWKGHKETSCVAILNKQKCHHFFYKITEQVGGTGSARGGEEVGTSARGGRCREKVKEGEYSANTVCTYVNGK
jgi:hypothetical protein